MNGRATLDHFELPVADAERTAAFLERAFGWAVNETEHAGAQRYLRLPATAVDAEPAGVHVGLLEGATDLLGRPLPVVRLEGESVGFCLERVVSLGGRVVLEPCKIGTSGCFARFVDPDGHEWGLWAPDDLGDPR